jgi:hypothetical protein
MYDISSTIQGLGVSDGTMMGIDMRGGISPEGAAWLKARIGRPSLATEMGLTPAGQEARESSLRGAINARGKHGKQRWPVRTYGERPPSRRHADYAAWAKAMQREGLYTLPDAAEAVGRTAPTVISWARRKHMPTVQIYSPVIGRPVSMVRLEDVRAWIDKAGMASQGK